MLTARLNLNDRFRIGLACVAACLRDRENENAHRLATIIQADLETIEVDAREFGNEVGDWHPFECGSHLTQVTDPSPENWTTRKMTFDHRNNHPNGDPDGPAHPTT